LNTLKRSLLGIIGLSLLGLITLAHATETKDSGVVVTDENFIHADSTRAYLKELSITDGKVNVIRPLREFANTDNQDIIRMNSDTLYTRIILDVKGGATVTTKAYDGFQNIQVLDPNHSESQTLMGAGTLKIDETMLTEGHHAYILIRTGMLRDLPEKEMYAKAYEAQDNIAITFNSSEPYVPAVNFDLTTLDTVKYKILENFVKHPKKDTVKNGFGTVESRDPDSARVVVAVGWGGLSGKNAVYSAFAATGERRSITIKKPNLNDKGKGFFSFTIYNADGYIATMNYAINSDDMVVNEDGTYTVNFLASGEPENGLKNVVRTPRGKLWTGVFRCYYPNDKDETFAFADAVTAKMTKEFNK
jgi:hypothetical protein